MPQYDFRCKACQHEFAHFYKTTSDYAKASIFCPRCAHEQVSRVIRRVAIQAPTRDFSRMNANEMLGVFESGDSRQVGQMFEQVSGSHPAMAQDYHETAQRLLRGESMDAVEQGLQAKQDATATPPPKPAKKAKKKKP